MKADLQWLVKKTKLADLCDRFWTQPVIVKIIIRPYFFAYHLKSVNYQNLMDESKSIWKPVE